MDNTPTRTIIKAGWIQRLSDILHIWKKEWCVIYLNGTMKFYKSDKDYQADRRIDLINECRFMLGSAECSTDTPRDRSRECLIGFKTHDGNQWFVGENVDDALAWRLVIEQFIDAGSTHTSRPHRPSSTPVHYDTPPNYYAQTPYMYQSPYPVTNPIMYGNQGQYVVPQTVINHPDGSQTVYVNGGAQNAFCCEYGCLSRHGCRHYNDAALGLGLGMATGALMFSPLMWGPFMW